MPVHYGPCVRCGGPVVHGRLLADGDPAARLCRGCTPRAAIIADRLASAAGAVALVSAVVGLVSFAGLVLRRWPW